MIEQIEDHLWRIEVPLPGNPLKSINSYVIKSPSRNLIIDTGLDRQECLDAILAGDFDPDEALEIVREQFGGTDDDVKAEAQAMGYEVHVVPLEYIGALEMAKILEPYVREGAMVRVDPGRSMISTGMKGTARHGT